MMKRLFWGTVLGGLVVFGWGAISWMVLPWHASTLRAFNVDLVVGWFLAGLVIAGVVRRD